MTGAGGAVDELAGFASGVSLQRLPASVREKARACLLYGLCVALASRKTHQPAVAAGALDIGAGAGGSATRLVDGAARPADDAAFANAVLLHSRVQEDAHPAGHVGVAVLPAAIAAAEACRASGADLLAGVVAGYEVALRIGRDHAADLSARGFRTTSVYGAVGAAVAVARVRGHDRGRMARAISLSANTASGLRAFIEEGAEDFAYQAGFAARNGMTAALLAEAGASASAGSLTGPAGLFAAFGRPDRTYADRLVESLGETFEFLEVTYKPYPVCQFHRAVVAGVLELRSRAGDAGLDRLQVRMNPFEADFWGVRHAGPFEAFAQTFMSAPFCAAAAWARGRVGLLEMHEFDAPDLLALLPRIEIVADAARDRYAPAASARLADGRVLDWGGSEPAAYRLGWPEAVAMAGALCQEAGLEIAADLAGAVEALQTAGPQGVDEMIRLAVSGRIPEPIATSAWERKELP